MKIEPSQKTPKSQLRKEIRSKRAAINPAQRERWDASINQHLDEFSRQENPATVAAFLAFDGEPDLMPFLSGLEDRGVTLALPVIQQTPGKSIITLRHWPVAGEMQKNRYGIDEPLETHEIIVKDIDLILVPLVGWDRAGGRLGMGASFYDRLFQPYSELAKPIRMGVGYELQNVDSIPCDPWDIHLHGILTENGWFTFTH